MNKNIKASIIIPAYNTADVIGRTLKSVESQTYKNYELVIINDGSTDEIKDFLDNYKIGKTNVIVHHQNNQGVSAARNKGIELAEGEFICFLDSDDTYEPTFLEKLIKKQNNTNSKIIYCGYNKIDINGTVQQETVNYEDGYILDYFLSPTNQIPFQFHLSCLLIKKSFLIENNIYFETGRKISEDIFFIINCLINSKASFVNENLFNYIFRQNSVVNSPSSKYLLKSNIDGWVFVKNHIESLDEYFFNKKYVINYINEYIFKLEIGYLSELMKNFNYKLMREYINENLFLNKYSLLNKVEISNSEKKKFNFIYKNNVFYWFIGSFYYKYLRVNLKNKLKAH